jgi:hypothetical protein
MIVKGNNLNKPHNSVITYILCYVYVKNYETEIRNNKPIRSRNIII